jgi:alcohol dehydrogenase (cytochrome c)
MGTNSYFKLLSYSAILATLVISLDVMADAELSELIEDPNYWVLPNGNYANWRYSELNQINSRNVRRLQAAWTFSTGALRGHEGGPLVLPASATGLQHDTLFIHSAFPNYVYAINLETLEIVWDYAPVQDEEETVPVMCCDVVNRGLGYGDGKIFLQQADTTLVALDVATGKPVWSVKNGDPKRGESNTNAPHVIKDKVITGISGGEFGVRGWVSAYDVKTGDLVWKAYSTGPDDEMLIDPEKTTSLGVPVGKDSSLDSWKGEQWKIGGGTTWGWWSYDEELNSIYYGTGNPGTWNAQARPGDNKWSMSIMSRNLDTGIANWVYQMTPHDEWDYDGVNEMILVDMKIDGKMTKALVHFDRNGFGYTLDRVNGMLLLAEKFDPTVNWASGIDLKTGRPQVVSRYSTGDNGEDVNTTNICPTALGSKDQQPAAYSPKTKLFYVPTNHVCMDYEPVSGGEYVAGQPYIDAVLTMFPAGRVSPGPEFGNNESNTNLGNFIAWDATKGKIVWSIPERFSVWSGALATAGDVVFYGTMEGYLKAIDAKSGKLLWEFKTPSGIIGNVNTWVHNKKQYIGVLSGVGGWAGIGMAAGLIGDTEGLGAVGAYRGLNSYTRLGGTLSVFALP